MTDSKKNKSKPGRNKSARSRALEKKREEAEAAARLQKQLATRAPATPLMMRTNQAWKTLCARTGGAISKRTFYNWIENMSVPSVRLGGRIFIPIKVLDELIERCWIGQPLM